MAQILGPIIALAGLFLQVLPPFRQDKGGVFGEGDRFVSMELQGREFKFSFSKEEFFGARSGTAYLKKTTEECAALANKFC